MKKTNDIQTALKQFEDAAILHAKSTEQGDYKTGNKCYATIIRIVKFLNKQNGIECLSAFLKHHSIGVRLWAATYLLPIQEYEAVNVLEQIAKETNIHALSAKTTLTEWRKGGLQLF